MFVILVMDELKISRQQAQLIRFHDRIDWDKRFRAMRNKISGEFFWNSKNVSREPPALKVVVRNAG